MRFLHPAFLSSILLLASLGCATLSSKDGVEPDYASEADSNLRLGTQALDEKDYERAEKYFEFVRTRFPYLAAANEAELRLADVAFEQALYPEAREKYLSFVKLHPTHSQADYAAWRAALTHAQEIPSDFFLLPPSLEKDQASVQAAQQALESFLRTYPSSSHAKEAQEKLDDVRGRLAGHELYVASFYFKRERWKAVVNRLEGMLDRYPGTSHEEEALFTLHGAYMKLNDIERARETLRRVISRLPGSPAAERARHMLGS